MMIRNDPEEPRQDPLESLRHPGELGRAAKRTEKQLPGHESHNLATLVFSWRDEETLMCQEEVKHSEARLPILFV